MEVLEEILLPALIITCGMLADSRAALVRSAGVGFPSGVIGIHVYAFT